MRWNCRLGEFGGAAFLSWTLGGRNHSRGVDDGSCWPPAWYREEGRSRRTDDSDTKSATSLDRRVKMTNTDIRNDGRTTTLQEFRCEVCGLVTTNPLHWFVIRCGDSDLTVY